VIKLFEEQGKTRFCAEAVSQRQTERYVRRGWLWARHHLRV